MLDDKHLKHYLVLFVVLCLCLALLLFFRFNRLAQIGVATFGSSFYCFWGIMHHALEERLNKKIVTEYILFGILAFLIISTALSV